MEKFLRNKLNIVLWVVAITVAVLIIFYVIATTHFLVVTMQEAYTKNLIKTSEIATFNLTKAEQLKRQ